MRWKMPPLGALTPARAGISPMTMSTTRPATKPVTMGSLRNWATHPSRSNPTATSTAPAVSARVAVRVMASARSPSERAPTIEPESTETVETGPTNSSLEEPNRA
jgi:hypothetical protein